MDNELELLCPEKFEIRALYDPVIFEDPRVVMRLLQIEDQFIVKDNYFVSVQKEVTPAMRKTVLTWLLEVSENENCEDSVFPLAVNYLDRFLALESVEKDNFQLLACVCLMLATKLRQSVAIGSAKLSAYCDFAYSPFLIVDWEFKILKILKWNLAAVTAHDFLDTIIFRLPDYVCVQELARKHAHTFQQLCLLEYDFTVWPPSHIAIGSIGSAIRNLPRVAVIWPHVERLPEILSELTEIEEDTIKKCIDRMDAFIDTYIRRVQVPIPEDPINKHYPDSPTSIKDFYF